MSINQEIKEGGVGKVKEIVDHREYKSIYDEGNRCDNFSKNFSKYELANPFVSKDYTNYSIRRFGMDKKESEFF